MAAPPARNARADLRDFMIRFLLVGKTARGLGGQACDHDAPGCGRFASVNRLLAVIAPSAETPLSETTAYVERQSHDRSAAHCDE